MKCKNCGYEFDKPNLKSCPLCGFKIIPGAQAEEDKAVIEERPTFPTEPSFPNGSTAGDSVEIEIPDRKETIVREAAIYSAPEPVVPEPPVIPKEPEPVAPAPEPVYVAPPVREPKTVKASSEPRRVPEETVTAEDPDEYVENGSYQPYPDEEEEGDETSYDDPTYQPTADKKSGTWIAVTIAAIAGLLIGSILYLLLG